MPREYLLLLLSFHGRDKLKAMLNTEDTEQKDDDAISEALGTVSVTADTDITQYYIVNRLTGRVFETNADAVKLVYLTDPNASIAALTKSFPKLQSIASR